MSYSIQIHNCQKRLPVAHAYFRNVIECLLRHQGIRTAELSVVITTDRGIRRVNKMFLNHDFPTDVITFDLSRDELSRRKGVRVRQVDGEMYVSAVTAARQAQVFGVPPQRELLLYITHGILHLLGYDDHTAVERKAMRMKEKEVLMFIQALPRGEGPEADFLERCFPR